MKEKSAKKEQSEEMAHIICSMASKPNSCKDCNGSHGGCFTLPKTEQLYDEGYRKVIQCKDCENWERYENTSGAGYCHNKKFCFKYGATMSMEFTPITMPNDFCSYGERRITNGRE